MIPNEFYLSTELKFFWNVLENAFGVNRGLIYFCKGLWIQTKRMKDGQFSFALFVLLPPGYHLFTDEEIGISEKHFEEMVFFFSLALSLSHSFLLHIHLPS